MGDVRVRAGEPVIVAIGAANRDALRFDDAHELRVDRPPAPHLGFGHGVHHRLGAAPARMELLVELPGPHVAGDLRWKTEMLVRGPVTMPTGGDAMTWRVRVNRAECLGSGMCAALAPELFAVDDVARPVEPEIEPDEVALDAADQCPAQAITVRASGTEIGPRP